MPSPWADFDDYCDRNGIEPGEEPAAFAAFLNERTGWDGPMSRLEDVEEWDEWEQNGLIRCAEHLAMAFATVVFGVIWLAWGWRRK